MFETYSDIRLGGHRWPTVVVEDKLAFIPNVKFLLLCGPGSRDKRGNKASDGSRRTS